MNNNYGPFGDPVFWKDIGNRAVDPKGIFNTLKGFGDSASEQAMAPAYRAGDLSREAFPEQEWDNTQRNALRHSLWVGSLAKAMGASPDNPVRTPIAQGFAKLAGYGHEALSGFNALRQGQDIFSADRLRDTGHDLNNNAVGAAVAGRAKDATQMNEILTQMAINARRGQPVNPLAWSDGQLSADPSMSATSKPAPMPRPR